MRIFSISLAIGFSIAGLALAAEPCDPNACTEVQVYGNADRCGHCGCNSRCEKYCRVVCEIKEVKKYVWVVECEEFCPPLPNRGGGCCDGCRSNGSCNPDCGCCDGKRDPCAVEKNKSFIPPKCGKMRVKKKLIKKEIVCKVPVYKCVVVYCCPKCESNECGTSAPPPTPANQTALPPAPVPHETTGNASLPPVLGAL